MDLTKGLDDSITYNYLNKPVVLDFGNGEKIEYCYDGAGNKLAKEVTKDNVLDESSLIYAGNFVNDFTGNLKYFLTSEGRIVPDSNDYRFEYFMKDHLGNTRATYAEACIGVQQVAEYNHYYPFGMQMEALCYSSGADLTNNHLYNGKELQPDYGLQWYDYGARMYDPEIGRWNSVDPMAEKSRRWSPYNYGLDNPMRFIDPDGMDVDWYQNSSGSGVIWQSGDATNISVNGESFSNIGESYTKNEGNGVSVTYTQNEATKMTFTGLTEKDFVSQISPSGCKNASDQMLAKEKVNSNGERINIVNADDNGVVTTANANASKGIKAIDAALENGKPIEAGVDCEQKQIHNLKPTGDGMTDHFIDLSSKTETLNNGRVTSKIYNFFDPRSSSYGTSTSNTLRIISNKLVGAFRGKTVIPYTVTTIRRSTR